MKSKLIMLMSVLIIAACSQDGGIDSQTLQNGAQHLSNIIGSKNTSEAIANTANAVSDFSVKSSASTPKNN